MEWLGALARTLVSVVVAVSSMIGTAIHSAPVDPPDHGGMIDRQLLGGSRNRSAADDRQHETEVIPVDRLGALIQHFRTSKVQYIRLVS